MAWKKKVEDPVETSTDPARRAELARRTRIPDPNVTEPAPPLVEGQ